MRVLRGGLAGTLCVAVAFAGLSGTAQAQLLYDSKLDMRAKAALAQYEEAKKAHLALLDARIADIDRQEKGLVDAAVRTNLAERDAAIVEILGEDERASARARLRGITVSRINAIVPDTFDANLAETKQLKAVADVLTSIGNSRADPLSVPTQRLAQRVDMIKNRFRDAKRKPTHGVPNAPSQADWTVGWYCRFVVLPYIVPGGDQQLLEILKNETGLPAKDAEDAARDSYNYCSEIAEPLMEPKLPDGFQSAQARFAMMALAGWKTADSGITIDSTEAAIRPALRLGVRIREVADQTAALKAELAEAEAKAKRLKEERDKLKKLLSGNEYEAQLQRVTCFVRDIVGDAGCPEKVIAEAPKPLASLAEVRDALLQLTALGPELDKLKQDEVFDIIRYLGDPAGLRTLAVTHCQPGQPPADDAAKLELEDRVRLCTTDAVMRGLGLIDQAGKIRQGIPGKVAELAVTLADAELHATAVRQRASALADRAANLEGQRRALIAELRSLKLAYDDANSAAATPGRIDRGIVRLAQSVDSGRAAEERLVVRYGFIGQREFADRERAIAAARYAMSDALLATLQASAAGGLKPEAVGQILAGLGLSARGITEIVE